MQLRIVSATISKTVYPERPYSNLYFGVEPSGRDQIALATGEVFKDRRRTDESDAIEGQLGISRASDGKAKIDEEATDRIGRMSYLGSVGKDYDYHPASIYLKLYLPDAEFDQLTSAVMEGKAPTTMTFDVDGLDYGNFPDGSRMKWDNTAQKELMIKEVTWAIEALKPPEVDVEPQEPALEREVKALGGALRNVRTQLNILIALAAAAVVLLWQVRHP